MLAKLTVGHPGLTFPVGFKGQRVDQRGPPIVKLDIECAGVFEAHAVLKRNLLDFQSGQRRVLELAEAPFPGIADVGQGVRPYHPGRPSATGKFRIDLPVGYQ